MSGLKISVEIGEQTLKQLIIDYLKDKLNHDLTEKDVKIEVKSNQNYKSEWEVAAFRARIETTE